MNINLKQWWEYRLDECHDLCFSPAGILQRFHYRQNYLPNRDQLVAYFKDGEDLLRGVGQVSP